ncbi:hypothetical protein NZK33_01010 [Cyanobium sp. FGCU-6]|jgi:hypothetical protein|nr:hypothetical protein [Cyanobium sp. FGCU6]
MADPRDRSHSGSAVLLSAVAGAALGAAGLGWWLLREADRRRRGSLGLSPRPRANLPEGTAPLMGTDSADGRLQDRVQQLNQAIDEVRRQLEQLQTHG